MLKSLELWKKVVYLLYQSFKPNTMTTEIIEFFPDNWQAYWPAINVASGYPYVNVHVSYLSNGSMILRELSFPKRELILFDFTQMPALTLEVLKLVSNYNSVEV